MEKTPNTESLNKYLALYQKILEIKTSLDGEINHLNKDLAKSGEDYLETGNGSDRSISKIPSRHPRETNSEALYYEFWIGDLGKVILNLHKEISQYKLKHTAETERNIHLSDELHSLKQKAVELDRSLFILTNFKGKANILYDQLFTINAENNSNNRFIFLRIRNKFKRAINGNPRLQSLYSKAILLIKAVLSLHPRRAVQEARLFKKHDWQVNFLRSSHCFDYYYFFSHYDDILQANIDPVRHFVVKGYLEGRNPNAVFNTNWYLDEYADVRKSGENALIHYLQKGILEGRRANSHFDPSALDPYLARYKSPADAFSKFLHDQSYDSSKTTTKRVTHKEEIRHDIKTDESGYSLKQIVYISGLVHNTSHQFRVTDQLMILKELGYETTYIAAEEAEKFQHLLIFAEVIVIFRTAWNQELEDVLAKCREAGVVIVYDTDDFVFDPRVANEKYVDGIRFLNEQDIKMYHEGVARYRRLIELSDFGIFTTARLTEAYKTLFNKEAFQIKNGFSDYFLEVSRKALAKRNRKDDLVIMGYASGSLTHQKDFRIASGSISRVLRENPNARLRIVGLVKIGEFAEFDDCAGQIQVLPVAPHDKLAYEIAEFDINLAPLEIDNPFCEAKSELKYFEAALVKVPTVASATQPYRMAIENNATGYLAHTAEDWYNYLTLLVRDARQRESVALAAYKDSLKKYSYEGKKKEVQVAFERIYQHRKFLLANNKFTRTITFVLPEMSRGSGGHAKAISVAKGLSNYDHTITLNFIGHHRDYPEAEEIMEEFNLNPRTMRVVYSHLPSSDSNIIFATFWKTVYYIEKSPKWFGRKYHFLQDYEPFFYAMSTDYLLAINAMQKAFFKVSYGPWIKDIIKRRHNIDCRDIPYYYNKEVYYRDDSLQRKQNTILFFARPEMPRRCFELGLKALEAYREKYGNEAEILFFGSTSVERIQIGFEFTDMKVRSPKELAYLYQTATLGVAFSPTNPSMVPFEMMACGLPVLDLDVEGNEINYGGRENVYLVNPDADEIAETINDILNNTAMRKIVGESGAAFIQQLPTEKEAILGIENLLSAKE